MSTRDSVKDQMLTTLHEGLNYRHEDFQSSCRDYVTLSENKNQHVCHRVQRLSSKFQGFECGQHLDFKFLVMHIQRVKVLRRTTALGSTHSGQYRFDHLLAKDEQRRQRADAWSAHPVPPRFTDPLHKRLAPQLAQVVTRFAIPIAPHRSSLLRPHSLG